MLVYGAFSVAAMVWMARRKPVALGDIGPGQRRIVPLTGGTFTGPQSSGTLVPGASADWQAVLPDGTALGHICHTLQPTDGGLLYVQSRNVRHRPAAKGVFTGVAGRQPAGVRYETYLVR